MGTPRSQRIGIWIITVVMAVGAVGVYFVAILANNNDTTDQQKAADAYTAQMKAATEARTASSKPLDGYSADTFDAASVTQLITKDLVVGTGKDVTSSSTIEANYFGWTADGKIFDSTNQNGTVTPATFSLSQVISGWTQGLAGAKEGTIRELTIPTDLAYGATAAANNKPTGPLKFIVEVKSVQ